MSSNVSLTPTSLIMRPDLCFYCRDQATRDVHTHIRLYGIRTCDNHAAAANRDCKAYLHEMGKVTIRDAFHNMAIKVLLDILTNEVYIVRTNGALDNCWTLNNKELIEPLPLSRIGEDWCVPMIRQGHVTKNVAIKSFLRQEVKEANMESVPADMETIVADALKALTDGIYIAEYNEHKYLGTPGAVQETSGVKTVWVGDHEVRVYDVA